MHRQALIALVWGSALILGIGCGSAPVATHDSAPHDDAAPAKEMGITDGEAHRIVEQVSAARGLSIDKAVPITLLDDGDFVTALEKHLHGEPNSDGSTRENSFLAAFDFLTPKDKGHSLPSMDDVLKEEVVGFYSPEDDRIFVPSKSAHSDEELFVSKAVLAHEAQHALQKRHFDLPKKTSSSDAELAQLALIEGDAQVAMGAYLGLETGQPAGRTVRRINEATKRVPLSALDRSQSKKAIDRTLALARERLEFPYREGMMFVSDVYRAGGFQLVNLVYQAPPTTTEQVLHPEKYLAGEAPRAFKKLPAQPGLTPISEDVLGEFQTRVLLERCLDSRTAERAAAGWNGDRYTVMTGDNGALVLAWSTAWDNENDAREFEAAVSKSECWTDNGTGDRHISKEVHVERKGANVALVRGADGKVRDKLIEALLDQSGPQPESVAISALRIPPRVKLPEPDSGKISGDVYENAWLGVVARIPGGMTATLDAGDDFGMSIEREGEAVSAGLFISTRLATDELNEKTFDEMASFLKKAVRKQGLSIERLHTKGSVSTPLGPGMERAYRVVGTTVTERVVMVPICANTGSIVLLEVYGNDFARSVVKGFVNSFRFTNGRNLVACNYLDPK